jgi:hypothetical protein
MKRGYTRPFTAPRASKPVETIHRKDNTEWGKRMERQLAQIEKDRQALRPSKTVITTMYQSFIKYLTISRE